MLLNIVFYIDSEQSLSTEHRKDEIEVVVFSWSRIECQSSFRKFFVLCTMLEKR